MIEGLCIAEKECEYCRTCRVVPTMYLLHECVREPVLLISSNYAFFGSLALLALLAFPCLASPPPNRVKSFNFAPVSTSYASAYIFTRALPYAAYENTLRKASGIMA
jgi:hypothetical protein